MSSDGGRKLEHVEETHTDRDVGSIQAQSGITLRCQDMTPPLTCRGPFLSMGVSEQICLAYFSSTPSQFSFFKRSC
ncbi:hypothetical protein GN956_G19070 [Arapaima gigas]